MMLIDIANVRWVPFAITNLSEDIPGYIAAPDKALSYSWKHFIGGHLGKLGTRDDLILHQQFMADVVDGVKKAIVTVDPTPYFEKYGENAWAVYKHYLDAITELASAPIVEKYTGVLGAADVYSASTVFWTMQSLRLDLGLASQVHP
jgi:hypothetical protein